MPTVRHFEIPANNTSRAREFYGKMFGWKFKSMDEDMDYWAIRTGEHEKVLGGGIMKRQMKDQSPVNYINVKSVAKSLKKAEDMGSRIIAPKTAVPKMGYWAVVTDTERNPVGLWEDNPKAM